MQTTAVISISIKIISVVSGIVIFYLISGFEKERRKKLAEEAVSQIINFVLFIWLAKVLLDLPLFLSEPLAALAYPSGSNAFYLAILFSAGLIGYGMKKERIEGWAFIQTLLYILLPASFFYEFAGWTWNNESSAFGSIVLYAVLLMLFLVLNDRVSPVVTGNAILSGWTGGILLLLMIQPHVSMFGYLLEPWFIVILFTAGQFLMFLHCRRSVIDEHN
ncbi:hypothetical protein MKY84_01840 [Chryseomicrobium sp. FSL W7-1435]|uniref:hypothetical protein n=1 Tax=Chryseomicrobium sp. FSL W7-1435 TaxID=2921704 RepID=UPI00315AE16E